jgi:HKD family nuclease
MGKFLKIKIISSGYHTKNSQINLDSICLYDKALITLLVYPPENFRTKPYEKLHSNKLFGAFQKHALYRTYSSYIKTCTLAK